MKLLKNLLLALLLVESCFARLFVSEAADHVHDLPFVVERIGTLLDDASAVSGWTNGIGGMSSKGGMSMKGGRKGSTREPSTTTNDPATTATDGNKVSTTPIWTTTTGGESITTATTLATTSTTTEPSSFCDSLDSRGCTLLPYSQRRS